VTAELRLPRADLISERASRPREKRPASIVRIRRYRWEGKIKLEGSLKVVWAHSITDHRSLITDQKEYGRVTLPQSIPAFSVPSQPSLRSVPFHVSFSAVLCLVRLSSSPDPIDETSDGLSSDEAVLAHESSHFKRRSLGYSLSDGISSTQYLMYITKMVSPIRHHSSIT
jgi:hypothetical protein